MLFRCTDVNSELFDVRAGDRIAVVLARYYYAPVLYTFQVLLLYLYFAKYQLGHGRCGRRKFQPQLWRKSFAVHPCHNSFLQFNLSTESYCSYCNFCPPRCLPVSHTHIVSLHTGQLIAGQLRVCDARKSLQYQAHREAVRGGAGVVWRSLVPSARRAGPCGVSCGGHDVSAFHRVLFLSSIISYCLTIVCLIVPLGSFC